MLGEQWIIKICQFSHDLRRFVIENTDFAFLPFVGGVYQAIAIRAKSPCMQCYDKNDKIFAHFFSYQFNSIAKQEKSRLNADTWNEFHLGDKKK